MKFSLAVMLLLGMQVDATRLNQLNSAALNEEPAKEESKAAPEEKKAEGKEEKKEEGKDEEKKEEKKEEGKEGEKKEEKKGDEEKATAGATTDNSDILRSYDGKNLETGKPVHMTSAYYKKFKAPPASNDPEHYKPKDKKDFTPPVNKEGEKAMSDDMPKPVVWKKGYVTEDADPNMHVEPNAEHRNKMDQESIKYKQDNN